MASLQARTNVVFARNDMGRFISECDAAATRTVERTVQHGERVARSMAPKKTGRLAASIRGYLVSAREGVVIANAPYALAQEKGAGPHIITGNPLLSFFWENAGVSFHGPKVNHPGNPPHPYLSPAYHSMARRMMRIASEEFPG